MSCSFIYRLIFSVGTGRFRTRNADCLLLSKSRFCCFLTIDSISSGWMFLLRPHFLIRSLYCFGLVLSQLPICNRVSSSLRGIKPVSFSHEFHNTVQSIARIQPCDFQSLLLPVLRRVFSCFVLLATQWQHSMQLVLRLRRRLRRRLRQWL
jgi:hypothetical protein